MVKKKKKKPRRYLPRRYFNYLNGVVRRNGQKVDIMASGRGSSWRVQQVCDLPWQRFRRPNAYTVIALIEPTNGKTALSGKRDELNSLIYFPE